MAGQEHQEHIAGQTWNNHNHEQLYLRKNYQNSCSLNRFIQVKLITGFYEFGWNLIKSDLCTIMIKIYMRTGENHQLQKALQK